MFKVALLYTHTRKPKTKTKMKINLTALESSILCSIAKGMDEPNQGWWHELDVSHAQSLVGDVPNFPHDQFRRVIAGVLGSLVKKGLATTTEESVNGTHTVEWVALTEQGEANVPQNR